MSEPNPFFRRLLSDLKDRDRLPRCLWWPRNHILVGESEQARVHEECSATINRAFLSIATYSLFCLIALGGSDVDLLGTEGGEITVPFTGVRMSVKAFLIVGPLILIALTVYLHLFIEEWSKLHYSVSKDKRTAKFFNFDGKLAKIITSAAFYWWTPLILYFFYWKSLPLPVSGVTKTIFVFSSLTIILVAIRRCPESKRRYWNASKWLVILALGSWSMWTLFDEQRASRPLLLSDSKLEGRNLIGLDFNHAEMTGSNLKGANLSNATLTNSDLTQSQLAQADFTAANLSHAVLNNAAGKEVNFTSTTMEGTRLKSASFEKGKFPQADLSGANLTEANFTGADLSAAKLKGAQLHGSRFTDANLRNVWFNGAVFSHTMMSNANLQAATFENADLSSVIGLTLDQLRSACIIGKVTLPKGLILNPNEARNCPPSEPVGLRLQ